MVNTTHKCRNILVDNQHRLSMDYESITQNTYTAIASHWDTKRQTVWKPVCTFIDQNSNPHNTLVDIGCGNGRFLHYAANKYKKVIGIDNAPGQVTLAQSKGLTVLHADMKSIPLPPNTANTLICIAALHHITQATHRIIALTQMYTLASHNAKLLLSMWQPASTEHKKWTWITPTVAKVTYTAHKTYDRYYVILPTKTIKEECQKAGWTILKTHKYQDNQYLTLTK